MTFTDKEKLASLRKTLDINYQVTNLYARYVGNFPELIKKGMVDTLVSDCNITKTERMKRSLRFFASLFSIYILSLL